MSKRINNYRGRHRGYLQNKAEKQRPEKKGVPPIMMMWMNYAAKMGKFMKTRNALRAKLRVKGKKALTGAKRLKVSQQFTAVAY